MFKPPGLGCAATCLTPDPAPPATRPCLWPREQDVELTWEPGPPLTPQPPASLGWQRQRLRVRGGASQLCSLSDGVTWRVWGVAMASLASREGQGAVLRVPAGGGAGGG